MRIRVKLYASLSDLLPQGVRAHEGVELDLPDDTTPYNVIDHFHIPRPMAHLVLCNGVYIKPEQRDQPCLKSGDVFAVWPPIAGG